MADKSRLNFEVLSSFLAGTATSDEEAALELWFQENPKEREWLNAVRKDWKTLPTEDIPELDLIAFKQRFKRSTDIAGSPVTIGTPNKGHGTPSYAESSGASSLRTFRVIGYLTATIAIIAIAWLSGYNRMTHTLSENTSVYATANGERANVTLPDGSVVRLNVGSKLKVSAGYSVSDRTVDLDGEAYFAVQPNASAPFIVRTAVRDVTVLGTRFVVRHYSSFDNDLMVAVQDGKVSVESIVLAANEAVEFSDLATVRRNSSQSDFSFTDNVLTLSNRTLKESLPDLNRWFDVEIRFGDSSIGDRKIYGELGAGSISDLTEYLEKMFDVRAVRTGRILTLYLK